MNEKFDELAKDLAKSATRRQALKTLGAGVLGAWFGLARAAAGGNRAFCRVGVSGGGYVYTGQCVEVNSCLVGGACCPGCPSPFTPAPASNVRKTKCVNRSPEYYDHTLICGMVIGP
jgi:hypothetical protein